MRVNKPRYPLLISCLLLVCPLLSFAATNVHHSDPVAPVIIGVTGILFFAILGRFLARKLNQPSVLGELLMGVLVGNLFYFLGFHLFTVLREGPIVFTIIGHTIRGMDLTEAVRQTVSNTHYANELIAVIRGYDSIEILQVAYVVDVFSRYGVIFLLFLVGLESSVEQLKSTGWDSFRVAMIGVLAPIGLGFIALEWLLPGLSLNTNLFIAATLGATSISISARVLSDLNQTRSREAQVILGAAMFDDILGLIILAIVTSIITTGSITAGGVSRIVLLAALFIMSALYIGPFFLRGLVHLLRRMDLNEAKLFISFLFVMVMAWFASIVELATIVGAFAAGLILHEGYFYHWGDSTKHQYTIKDLVSPLESILAPIFFVLIGIQVKLETFFDWHVLFSAIILLIAAILGKLLCGIGVKKGFNRLAIGLGMLPRGEVGLVFASIGKNLGVISDSMFAAVILMVIVTTLISPPLLKLVIQKRRAV